MPVDDTVDMLVSPRDVRHRPADPGHPSVRVLSHGSMEVRWFRPDSEVQHEPHDRDELYFVVSGTARFRRGTVTGPFDDNTVDYRGPQVMPVAPGDVLFVPAGAPHNFDETSPDFAVWAVFYGPEGGEAE